MQYCASPDIAEAIFETRGTNQVCEWLNDGINGDSICYCKSDECNTIETLASWIQNGGVGKFHFSFFFLVFSMALPVMEFQDQGYKIRKIFA